MSIYEELLAKSGSAKQEIDTKLESFLGKHPDLNKELASFFIAKELGIEIDDSKITICPLNLLDENNKNANILVTVERAFPKKEYDKNEKKGTLQNLVVTDNTQNIGLSVWDNQEEFRNGDVLLVTNTFMGEFKGEKKLNTSKMSTIKIKDRKEQAENSTPAKKLLELESNEKGVTINVILEKKYPVKTFEREGQQKELLRFSAFDSGYSMNGVAWDSAVNVLKDIDEDTKLKIENCNTKINQGRAELSLGKFTKIIAIGKNSEVFIPEKKSISELGFTEVVELNVKITNINNLRVLRICKDCGATMFNKDSAYFCPICNSETQNYLKAALTAEIEDTSGHVIAIFKKSCLLEMTGFDESTLEKDAETYEFKNKQVNVVGYLRKNKQTQENEFLVLNVKG